MSTAVTITITTADGDVYHVPENVAMEFPTIHTFFTDSTPTPDTKIPLPNVTSEVLNKIIDYTTNHLEFRKHHDPAEAKAKGKAFDEKFVAAEENEMLIELILGANYLETKELLDLLSKGLAERIKNKSVEYVRKLFAIENDFTAEEEEKLRNDNAWSFEGVDEDTVE